MGGCGAGVDNVVLADAIFVGTCKNGCRGGVAVMRVVIEDALKVMAENDKVVAQYGS